MTYLSDEWKEVKSKPISELFDYLTERTNTAEGVELFKYTRAMAEVALAIYDFDHYLKEKEDAKS